MSRSCYSDDYGDEYPGQLALFRANVQRSIRSKKGQARLRELRDALLALPTKELEYGTFATGTPEAPKVCALGAWALAKTHGDPVAANGVIGGNAEADDMDTAAALESYGWPKLVVLEAIYRNDEGHPFHAHTPEKRYKYVLKWVNEHILPAHDGSR